MDPDRIASVVLRRARANGIYQWAEGEETRPFLEPVFEGDRTGLRSISSNGLTLDAEGRLILCEHGNRRISRLEADGSRTTLVDRYEGKRLNNPNDATYSSDGWLYFTDPPYGMACTTWGGRGTSAHTDAGGPMRAYSMDLRARALLDSDAGMQAADVAAKYRVSGSWVRRLKQRRRETGEVAPRVQRHGRRCMREPHLHTVAALIAAHPDRTLAELKDALATPASVPTVWRAVRALGLTVQQNGTPVRTRSA